MTKKQFFVIALFFAAAIFAFVLNWKTESRIKKTLDSRLTTETAKKSAELVSNFEYPTNMQANMFDILDLKQAMRCTFIKPTSQIPLEGTLYTDGNSTRTNLRSINNQVETQENAIFTKDMVYIWQTGDPQGIQMSMELYRGDLELNETSTSQDKVKTANINEEFVFNCNKWVADPNMFVNPAGLNFVDISDALNKIKESPCLVCDAMTDSSRQAQCRINFKCK